MKRYLLIIPILVLVAVTGAFAMRNTSSVTIDLLLTRHDGPVVAWLIAAVCLGAGLTLACLLPSWWRRRGEQRRLRRELASVREECDRLRRAPLRDD